MEDNNTWVDPNFSGLVPPSAQEGIVYKEFVPTGQTVNSDLHVYGSVHHQS
jgi:hypothetical protein